MGKHRIGILHPGNMGVSVAASVQAAGHPVSWASEGRSAATQARALDVGLEDLGTVAGLCMQCALLISVCPPHAAEEVAAQIFDSGFRGAYLGCECDLPNEVATDCGAGNPCGCRLRGWRHHWRPGMDAWQDLALHFRPVS